MGILGSRKRKYWTSERTLDIDQVQEMLKKEAETNKKTSFEYDEDVTGGGQFYCTPCAKHFTDQKTLDVHKKTKPHKKRLKALKVRQYTHEESELAAGKTREILPPAHPSLKRVKTSSAKKE